MEVPTHMKYDYGENVKDSGWKKFHIFLFYTVNDLWPIKKSKRKNTIAVTHNEDLWHFQETE